MHKANLSIGDETVLKAPAASAAAKSRPVLLSRSARRFRFLVLGVAAGYFLFGRTFAYMGLPGLYPGEILLVVAALGPYNWIRTLISAINYKPVLALSVLLFLVWGCMECFRGYLDGYPTLDIAKGLPAHYYPLLLFAGMSAGRLITRGELKVYYLWLTIATGVWGIICTIANNREITTGLPWASDVAILGGPSLGSFCLIAYVAFSKRFNPSFALVCLPAAISLLIGGRAGLLSAAFGIGILLLRPGRRRLSGPIITACVAAVLLAVALSPLIPNLGGRTGRATPVSVLARVVAVFSADAAAELTQNTGSEVGEGLLEDAGDADWRRTLWSDTIASLTSPSDWLLGHEYGPVLGDILPGSAGEGYGHDLRTPHNFAIYLLGYTGLIGCGLFVIVLLAILRDLLRWPSSDAKDAALAAGISVIIMAVTGNLLETPFGAVPAYISIGILMTIAERQATLLSPDNGNRGSRLHQRRTTSAVVIR